MKISHQWLNDLVDLTGISASDVAHQLTMKTALIEGVTNLAAGLEDLVVGKVEERRSHPSADHLSVCKVNIAGPQLLEIVCGAANVAPGQHVAVAPVGSVLPGGLKLEERKIRGVRSQGMICSERELELGEEHDGILVLDDCAPVGKSLVDHLGRRDHVYEIDNKSITHRPDLWGHLGFARELAAIFERKLNALDLDRQLTGGTGPVPVTVDDPRLCRRYLALCVEGVATVPSRGTIPQRLRACGLRPVNLAVDLSNYVMLEIGQPTHPFDRDCLRGDRIVVRRAHAGEALETIDHVRRTLTTDMLVIADAERASAIAGIMGGVGSEIGAGTRRLVLESAAFDAINVRKTSAALGLRTDAVARFEKFLDPNLAETAVRRYSFLLKGEQPAAIVHRDYAEASTFVERPRVIALRPARVQKKLGVDYPVAEIRGALESIGYLATAADAALSVTVPSFRGERDITGEDDLIEEVGRMLGYERVPAILPRVACDPPQRDPLRELEHDLTHAFVQRCGFAEVIGYSMADDQSLRWAGAEGDPHYLRLRNPITADTSRLRRSLIPGMLRFADTNARFADEFALFEIGRGYLPERSPEPPLPFETRVLCALKACPASAPPDQALLSLKGCIEEALHAVGRPGDFDAVAAPPPWLHPVRAAVVLVAGTSVGCVGELHPEIAERMQLKLKVAIAELDLRALVTCARAGARFTAIPRFPAVKIDLAVVAGYDVTIRALAGLMRSLEPALLRDVELFDVFVGKGVPEGKRSLAFRLEFRADDRTLTDDEVLGARDRVVAALAQRGLTLRA
ncbi:MAG: phenylalanine--tRNA ligase subunit beta [Planctomycetota bacterium]